jgi:hypothetical protein
VSINPYRGADAAVSRIESNWQPVLLDLVELEETGALAGIRAIIAERLGQVRTGSADIADPARLAAECINSGNHAWTAALLAAEIDRIAGTP